MKSSIYLFILLSLYYPLNCLSQTDYAAEPFGTISIGFLRGGGSLVGSDIEFKLWEQVALQFGAGLVGFGGALNFHFNPSITSSCFSIGYFHQGIGGSFTQAIFGPTYIFRAKKIWTLQFGVGLVVDEGPRFDAVYPKGAPPFVLLYSAGIYFPLKSSSYNPEY